MNAPKVLIYESSQRFKYLWLKYVKGFNLEQHCAKSLSGVYSKRVSPLGGLQIGNLDESECMYYYLCGVTMPYKWENNLHIAFRYKKGCVLEYDKFGTKVVIQDAEEIPIKHLDNYDSPHCNNKAYTTCRNWQFAYQMTHQENTQN